MLLVRNFFCVFLLIGLIAMTLGSPAPADEAEKPADAPKPAEKTAPAADAAKKPEDKEKEKEKTPEKSDTKIAEKEDKKDNEKSGVVVSNQSWETYFTGSTAVGTIGTVLLLGLAAYGIYYYNYLYAYNGYGNVYDANQQQQYAGNYQQPYPYQQVARSLDTSSRWNWNQVLSMISLAQESYEKFDFQTLECQKKAMCELSHKHEDLGETGEKVSKAFTTFSKRFLYVVDGIPMPSIILNYLKEFREAMNQNEDCSIVYPTCTFSMKEVIGKYEKRSAAASVSTGVSQKL